MTYMASIRDPVGAEDCTDGMGLCRVELLRIPGRN